MFTTDIIRAALCDYFDSADPPDYLFCTPEQKRVLDAYATAKPPWHPLRRVQVHAVPWRGRHSRPGFVSDLDWNGRITP